MPTRIRGDGSIYWDASKNRFVGALVVDGKRRKVLGTTKKAVRARLDIMRTDIADGRTIGDGNTTVGALVERWKTKVLPGLDIAEQTRSTYGWSVDIIATELASKRVRTLTPDDVEEAFERIAATPTRNALTRDGSGSRMISRASLVKIRSVLGQVLDYAERRGLANRNVARVAILPAAARRAQAGRALTTDQARTLLEEARNDRLYALWVVQLMLGVRPGEAIGLTWDDVDLSGNILHIRRNLRFEHGRFVLGDELKTAKSRRSLTMPDPVLRALRDRQIEQRDERLTAGPLWSTEWPTLVFTTLVGTPLHASNVRRQFTAITERSGLGRWHPHELRHSAASILSAAGVPLERVADVLGHDGTRMTALVYRHAVSPSVDAARETMGNVFGVEPRR
jgi:integrase